MEAVKTQTVHFVYRLFSRYNDVNYGAWHVSKLSSGFSVAIGRSVFQLTEKGWTEVREMVGHSTNWQMA